MGRHKHGREKEQNSRKPPLSPISSGEVGFPRGRVSAAGGWGLLESWGEWLQIWGLAPWVVAEGDWGRSSQTQGIHTRALFAVSVQISN